MSEVTWSDGSCPVLRFAAMASPCEVLFDGIALEVARPVGEALLAEAQRIEGKWSRYRDDSVITRINQRAGAVIEVDDETALLLDYADTCYRLSEGRFDITSGVLRTIWRFHTGEEVLPESAAIEACRARIGWDRVRWQRPALRLAAGMQLDFGGIGKEYAVDRCVLLAGDAGLSSVLVNFGGDLAVCGPRADGSPWMVGSWDEAVEAGGPRWEIRKGGIATSGNTRRYFTHDGRRYGHILDPRSGWPVPEAPLSISVAAGTCSEAGTLATLAMLQGAGAEAFLEAQGVVFRCLRM